MEIKELKEEILKRYGRYLFGIVDIDVWYDRVEIVSRVDICKGGRNSSNEGTIVVSLVRDDKRCKECLNGATNSIRLGFINYLKIRCDKFKKDINGEYGLSNRLYYIAIDDRHIGDKILDIMSSVHKLRECKGFNVRVHNLL